MKLKILNKYNFLLIFFACSALILAHLCWANDEIKQFEEHIYNTLREKKFLELEKMAESFRREQASLSNGYRKLAVFYKSLFGDRFSYSIEQRKAYIRLLNEWNDTIKNSVTAKIALAEAYLMHAWDYRGGGYIDSVTTEGLNKFKENSMKAWELLEEAEELDNNDPHLYTNKIRLGMGMGVNKVYLYEAVRHSLLIDPGYTLAYASMATALFPQWYGEKGELARFADWLVAMTEEEYGYELYAFIARSTLGNGGEELFQRSKFDVNKIRKGFLSMREKFPNMGKYFHGFAWIFVQHAEHRDLANEIFQKIKFEDNKDFWKRQDQFDYWKNIAAGQSKSYQNNAVVDAALKGDLDLLKEAVEKGGDINAVDRFDNSALIIAIRNLNYPMAEYLVKSGIDFSLKNVDHNDAMYFAAASGLSNFVKLLLEKKADFKIHYNYGGYTPTHLVTYAGSLKALKLLVEQDRGVLYQKSDFGALPLHTAAQEGHEDIVEYILKVDSELVDRQQANKATPLHLAAENGHAETTKVLLDYGADINLTDSRGRTVYNMVQRSKDIQLINLLKDKGGVENPEINEENKKLAQEHYVKGNDYYNQAKWKESKAELQKAIEINPHHGPAYATYSILETYGFNNAEKGLEYADRAVELNPGYSYAYYVKGRALDALERKEEAFKAYRHFIEREDPESPLVKDLKNRYWELK